MRRDLFPLFRLFWNYMSAVRREQQQAEPDASSKEVEVDQGRRGGFRFAQSLLWELPLRGRDDETRIKTDQLLVEVVQAQCAGRGSVGRDGRTKRTVNNKGMEANETKVLFGIGVEEVVKGRCDNLDVPKFEPGSQLGDGMSGIGGLTC